MPCQPGVFLALLVTALPWHRGSKSGGLTEWENGEQINSGMKTSAKTDSAGGPYHGIHAAASAHNWGMIVVSFFLGMTALLVSFGAASAFENSKGELIAPCVAAVLYLAFCQFWVAPRGSSGFGAKLPTLAASVAPLLLEVNLPPRTWGIPWVMVSGCLGSVIGAMLAQWITATPQRATPTTGSIHRGGVCRRNLLAGFILLVAVALLIPIGVIPLVLADTAHGSYAHTNGVFLGATVVFDLLAALLLGFAVWRSQEHDHTSKGTLGIAAFLALFLGLGYCGMGVLFSGYGPALRIASVLLILCAIFGFITTALMTVTSVIVDRERLSKLGAVN